MADWGVILAQSQRHRTAVQSLVSAGFEYFLPLRETCQVKHGRHIRKRLPLFGRYIFVLIIDGWEQLSHLRGIAGLMMTSDTMLPALVIPKQFEAMRKFCDDRSIYREEPGGVIKPLAKGDVVYPIIGPFIGINGVYDGVVNKSCEAAILKLFGGSQRVIFRRGDLERVSPI